MFPSLAEAKPLLDLDYIFADPDPTAFEPLRVEDLPADRRVEWEERAAVMEYDGGIPKERAEAIALTEVYWKMQ
jgi:hypothetical protein